MKITKLVHSCLLVETDDRIALVDPGGWSWESGIVDVDSFPTIDRIIITHQHVDHCSPEFIQEVLRHSPNAQIVANEHIQSILKDANIDGQMRDETACSQKFTADHESIDALAPGATPPQTGFHFQDKLTLPGDSHSFNETKDILALAFVAPWGSVMDAMDAAIRLKPKHIIPVHDWFFTQDAKDWLYKIVAKRLAGEGITLHAVNDGDSIQL